MRPSMAIIDDESKSDGLEILSIGSLYAGPWDKKYWSSSRGKDRYPYPVGYQALRTHKGLTYKMEIHEGSKGPIFQINSNDKHLGSGETPDRACENFQKKCSSRIKLWHGKRSSGKIDGVEFFGFKNALVQRLLRELVATLNDASDQSSVFTNCDEASSKGHDVWNSITDECPDLRSYLEKTTVTGKRSRNCRGADKKSVFKNGNRICHPPHQGDCAEVLCSAPGKTDVNEPLISCALSDCHADGALQVISNKEHGENVPLSEQGLPVKSHELPADTKEQPCLIQKQSELSSMDTCTSAPLVGVDMPQEEKLFDRQSIEIQRVSLPVSTEEGSQKVQILPDLLAPGLPALSDSQANHYGGICVPDTLDTQQEFTCAPNFGSHGEEAAMTKNEPVADSVFSEESEFDSAEDITKSMMAILLPRAIPLLKYSSRKRRKTKPPKDLSCAPKPENNPNGAAPSADVKSPAGLPACSASDGQAKVHPPSAIDAGPSMMDTVRDVVPDSLDNDQDEDYVPNEPPPSFANSKAVAANLQKETNEPDEKQLSQNHCVLALHCAVPCPSSADANSIPVEICSKNTDLEILPDNCVPEMHHRSENLVSPKSCQVREFGDGNSSKASFIGGRLSGHFSNLQKDNVEDALAQNCKLQDQALSVTFSKNDTQFIDGCNSYARNFKADTDMDKIRTQHSDLVYQSQDKGRGPFQNCASQYKVYEAEIESSYVDKQELNDAIEDTMKLIGCYSHPMRISSVMLTRKPHEIYMCVSCGLLEEKKRDLFLYKLSVEESSLGSPCMAGHTSMSLPALKDEFGREIAVDKSGLQFTPDAKGLVLVDSIRMPYCREKNLHCLCPQCESCCFEENAVKIVQIKLGYVSLVVKLNTIYPVQCVLVCEPDHLIAVDESGRIYIWVMNSTWSVHTEIYVIPSNDFLPSRVVELKRIPKLASMVVGHNGYGEFSLWDILRRTAVSRFSAPANSVLDFLPVSMFNWPSNALSHNKADMEECVRKLEEATMLWFSRHSEANISCPMEGEDFAVWLLICTSSDSSAQSHYSSNCHLKSDGCWRLGLLIKDMVILGAALQLSCTAIGSTSGTGIVGTDGGQVYVWELATGNKLEALHDLEGNRVLHIATDDTTSSAVAIAGDGGQLCVYLHTRDLVKSA